MYSYSSTGYGEIFGLTSEDLTQQQLEKIQTQKLIEFIESDSRVERIIGDRVDSGAWDVVKYFGSYCDALKNHKYLIRKYNKLISSGKSPEDSYYYRNRYYHWPLLNEKNKIKECEYWINGCASSFDPAQEDFNWLFSGYLPLAEQLTQKIVDMMGQYNTDKMTRNLISGLPEQFLLKYLRLFKKHAKLYLLSNQYTPDKHMESILRYISGKSSFPDISVKLRKDVVLKLPSVMRLKSFETMIGINRYSFNKVKIVDITVPEDLDFIFFGTSMKYNSRVQKVVAALKKEYEKADE
ncbi:MAG: hypothetical protein WC523_04900 [Patescibacteria group bacterium]